MATPLYPKWLMWIGLYLILGVVAPWATARAWAGQHRSPLRPRPKDLFQRGEMGLVGLVLAIPIIWELFQSAYAPQTRALAAVLLAITGIMAGSVWIETYCRENSGTTLNAKRAWRDSRNMALLVFSIAGVMSILLDRLARAVAQ